MKTLADILKDPVDTELIIRTALVINKLIEDSKKAGVIWPELEDEPDVTTFNDVE